jgi:hypothetical protein
MANIIIYPQGNVGNTNPHVVFDDGVNGLQFNVGVSTLTLSSSTVSSGVSLGPTNVLVSGATINSTGAAGSLYVGGVQMVNSSAIWVGPTAGIAGAQGATGAAGTFWFSRTYWSSRGYRFTRGYRFSRTCWGSGCDWVSGCDG